MNDTQHLNVARTVMTASGAQKSPARRQRLVHLDFVRGLAALAVCAGHLRAFLMVGFDRVASPSVADKVFYLLTGLGHQAVMVFFVLSGYFVAGSVVEAWENGRWSWSGYALRRLTRLWTVLVPALFLTAGLDVIGSALAHGRGYDGSFQELFSSGPSLQAPAQLSFRVFAGNLGFLQTILVPVYGTNGPLWSLAYEFWYYLLFPLLWAALGGKGLMRFGSLVAAAVLIYWLPIGLLLGGIIWLMGFGAYMLIRIPALHPAFNSKLWVAVTSIFVLGTLVASRMGSPLGTGYVIGLAFALMLTGLAARNTASAWYRRMATGLSDVSYTLYATHFPALAFISIVWFAPHQYQPGWLGYSWFALLLVLMVAGSGIIWWLFESRTDRIRKFLERHLLKAKRGPTQSA